MNIAIN